MFEKAYPVLVFDKKIMISYWTKKQTKTEKLNDDVHCRGPQKELVLL